MATLLETPAITPPTASVFAPPAREKLGADDAAAKEWARHVEIKYAGVDKEALLKTVDQLEQRANRLVCHGDGLGAQRVLARLKQPIFDFDGARERIANVEKRVKAQVDAQRRRGAL